MLIKNILKKDPVIVKSDNTIADVIGLFIEKSVRGCVVVDEEKRVLGAITIGDIIRGIIPLYLKKASTLAHYASEELFAELLEKAKGRNVSEFMITTIPYIKENDTLIELAVTELKPEYRHIPVVDDDNKLVGVVGSGELIRAVATLLQLNK